jgi:hypothetical protein
VEIDYCIDCRYWVLFIGLLKRRKEITEEIYKTQSRKPPLADTLEKKELCKKGEVKAYYSELTDIARNYIEEAIEIPAMESTTSELIQGWEPLLKKKWLSSGNYWKFRACFETSRFSEICQIKTIGFWNHRRSQ